MREYMIMELVNTITDKPNWQQKAFDDTIVAKWRAEALSTQPEGNPEAVAATLQADESKKNDITHNRPNTPGSEASDSQWSAYHAPMDVSPKMFDWAIAEVRYKAEIFKQTNCIEALDGVWKSDTVIGEDLRKALEKAVRQLEDVPSVSRVTTVSFLFLHRIRIYLCLASRDTIIARKFRFLSLFMLFLNCMKDPLTPRIHRKNKTGIPAPTTKY